MNPVFETEVLVDDTKRGNKKFWQGRVLSDGFNFFTQSSFWQETADGLSKIQDSEPTEIFGKNKGKVNETTPEEQAVAEIKSFALRQRDKGYHGLYEQGNNRPLPMLAHKFEDRKGKIDYPVAYQFKYDGTRVLYDGDVGWSRKGKDYIPEVLEHLQFDTQGFIVDGELDLPLGFTFQDKMKAIKKYSENSPKLILRLYDLISDKTFGNRYGMLTNIVAAAHRKNPSLQIEIAPTVFLDNEYEIQEWHNKAIEEGWEGSIIRTLDMPYQPKVRSNQLLKHKNFDDDEFLVSGVIEGIGKFKGVPILQCLTKEGNGFQAVPKGKDEYRRELFRNAENEIGQYWTVRYQGLSEEGIPRFPVAIARRDYE